MEQLQAFEAYCQVLQGLIGAGFKLNVHVERSLFSVDFIGVVGDALLIRGWNTEWQQQEASYPLPITYLSVTCLPPQ